MIDLDVILRKYSIWNRVKIVRFAFYQNIIDNVT